MRIYRPPRRAQGPKFGTGSTRSLGAAQPQVTPFATAAAATAAPTGDAGDAAAVIVRAPLRVRARARAVTCTGPQSGLYEMICSMHALAAVPVREEAARAAAGELGVRAASAREAGVEARRAADEAGMEQVCFALPCVCLSVTSGAQADPMGGARAREYGPHLPRMPRVEASARVDAAFPSNVAPLHGGGSGVRARAVATAVGAPSGAGEHPPVASFERPQALLQYAAQLKVRARCRLVNARACVRQLLRASGCVLLADAMACAVLIRVLGSCFRLPSSRTWATSTSS